MEESVHAKSRAILWRSSARRPCCRWAAQPPADKPADDAKDKAKDYSNAPLVVRMMAFDKKKDGKLTKDEVTDERLQRLFDQADANKDGVVTKEELMALAAKLDAEQGTRRAAAAAASAVPAARPRRRPAAIAVPAVRLRATAVPTALRRAAPAGVLARLGPVRFCRRSCRKR